MTTYQEPIKEEARVRLLDSAVTALTSERHSSALIRAAELQETVEYAIRILASANLPDGFPTRLREQHSKWEEFHAKRHGNKEASELKVLYLCGPEPLNDLLTMMSLGVDPHNVWAVTSSQRDLEKAVAEVSQANVTLKIHHGNLTEFFEVFPESFDIVYVDGCGPFTGGKPNTLSPILSVFVQQRLQPLSALITTFCEVPSEEAAAKKYIDVMTAFFRYRYRDLPREAHQAGLDPAENEHEPVYLRSYISDNTELIYSEFITKLLCELAGCWIPNCRALAMRALFQSYVAPAKVAAEAVEKATDRASKAKSVKEFAQTAGHAILSPSSYPLLSFFNRLKEDGDGVSLGNQLGDLKINGREMGALLEHASLLDRVLEGHWDSLSEKLKIAVAVSWFDKEFQFSCDAPLPNLLINSLLGIYGRPWFVNPAKSVRLSYRAKSNRMFCDSLILDQCRSFFDWWPTIDLCPSRFESIEFQVLSRCIIDRIGWHNWNTDNHPFRGGAVACMNETTCAEPYDFAPRESLDTDE